MRASWPACASAPPSLMQRRCCARTTRSNSRTAGAGQGQAPEPADEHAACAARGPDLLGRAPRHGEGQEARGQAADAQQFSHLWIKRAEHREVLVAFFAFNATTTAIARYGSGRDRAIEQYCVETARAARASARAHRDAEAVPREGVLRPDRFGQEAAPISHPPPAALAATRLPEGEAGKLDRIVKH